MHYQTRCATGDFSSYPFTCNCAAGAGSDAITGWWADIPNCTLRGFPNQTLTAELYCVPGQGWFWALYQYDNDSGGAYVFCSQDIVKIADCDPLFMDFLGEGSYVVTR